jgi:hypothetical protein
MRVQAIVGAGGSIIWATWEPASRPPPTRTGTRPTPGKPADCSHAVLRAPYDEP